VGPGSLRSHSIAHWFICGPSPGAAPAKAGLLRAVISQACSPQEFAPKVPNLGDLGGMAVISAVDQTFSNARDFP
jgi:hypothetical protein